MAEFSKPASGREVSSLEDPSFIREKRMGELLKKWHIEFRGRGREDLECFLKNLYECKQSYGLSLKDAIRALPAVLDGDAWLWFRREYNTWQTYSDFVDAFRLQYCTEDMQCRLKTDIERRTQGPQEDMSTYLSKPRNLLDQRKPPLLLGEQ